MWCRRPNRARGSQLVASRLPPWPHLLSLSDERRCLKDIDLVYDCGQNFAERPW